MGILSRLFGGAANPKDPVQIALAEISSETVARLCQNLPCEERGLFQMAYACQLNCLMGFFLRRWGVANWQAYNKELANQIGRFPWFDPQIYVRLINPTITQTEAFFRAIGEGTQVLYVSTGMRLAAREAGLRLSIDFDSLLDLELGRQAFVESLRKAVKGN